MLLQGRSPVTAAELAKRLEVSTRTVYRDMEALQMAGVPVVALAGPGGGYSLYGEWKTDLAGLSADELTALAVGMVAGPGADPAVTQHIRTAVMKVAASLPEAARRNLRNVSRSSRPHNDRVPPGRHQAGPRRGRRRPRSRPPRGFRRVVRTRREPRSEPVMATQMMQGLATVQPFWRARRRASSTCP